MKNINKSNVSKIKSIVENKIGISLSDHNRAEPSYGRIRRKPLLTAAVIVLIASLTFSIAVIAEEIRGRKRFEEHIDDVVFETDENGFSASGKHYTFYLDFELEAKAPAEVKDFYLPQVKSGYELEEGTLYDGIDNGPIGVTTFIWRSQGNGGDIIMFYQYADLYNDSIRDNVVSVPMGIVTDGSEPSVTETAYGDVNGYLVSGSVFGEKYFVWSDGGYAYSLVVYSEELICDLVENIELVEDIRPYLVGMSDKEIDESLD